MIQPRGYSQSFYSTWEFQWMLATGHQCCLWSLWVTWPWPTPGSLFSDCWPFFAWSPHLLHQIRWPCCCRRWWQCTLQLASSLPCALFLSEIELTWWHWWGKSTCLRSTFTLTTFSYCLRSALWQFSVWATGWKGLQQIPRTQIEKESKYCFCPVEL